MSYVQVAIDGSGKKVDTAQLTDGSDTVQRQVIVTGDPTTAAAVGKVSNSAPSKTDYAVHIRKVDDLFTRITNSIFYDTEEVRYDVPSTLASNALYTGIATAGTSTATASWNVTRVDFDSNGNPSRRRFQASIAWDSRTSGWV